MYTIGKTKKFEYPSEEVIALGKLKNNKGLTLTELLCAIIVMLLVTGVMVVGIRLGTQAYVKSVSMSEAQQLCSTLTTKVSDELRYAGTIKVDSTTNTVKFFSKSFGKKDNDLRSFTQNEDGQVTLGETKIITSTSYPHNLKAKVDLSYKPDFDDDANTVDNGVFTATITVYRTSETAVLATTTFQVEPLNHVDVSGL